MKFQLLLLFALIGATVLMVEADREDDKCKKWGQMLGVFSKDLTKWAPFKMYPYDWTMRDCEKVCAQHNSTHGYAFLGIVACCCGTN